MPRPRGKTLAWEVDWTKRKRKSRSSAPEVWARNPQSYVLAAREWHWTPYGTLISAGVKWRARKIVGRSVRTSGYVGLRRCVMTAEQIRWCDEHQLWEGWNRGRRLTVKEHRLVACMKYGFLPVGCLVRHVNGDKADNRPENLVLGTHKDNSMDHKSAVALALHWRERAIAAETAKRRFVFTLSALQEAA